MKKIRSNVAGVIVTPNTIAFTKPTCGKRKGGAVSPYTGYPVFSPRLFLLEFLGFYFCNTVCLVDCGTCQKKERLRQ
jgi:hypothetical protein